MLWFKQVKCDFELHPLHLVCTAPNAYAHTHTHVAVVSNRYYHYYYYRIAANMKYEHVSQRHRPRMVIFLIALWKAKIHGTKKVPQCILHGICFANVEQFECKRTIPDFFIHPRATCVHFSQSYATAIYHVSCCLYQLFYPSCSSSACGFFLSSQWKVKITIIIINCISSYGSVMRCMPTSFMDFFCQ